MLEVLRKALADNNNVLMVRICTAGQKSPTNARSSRPTKWASRSRVRTTASSMSAVEQHRVDRGAVSR